MASPSCSAPTATTALQVLFGDQFLISEQIKELQEEIATKLNDLSIDDAETLSLIAKLADLEDTQKAYAAQEAAQPAPTEPVSDESQKILNRISTFKASLTKLSDDIAEEIETTKTEFHQAPDPECRP